MLNAFSKLSAQSSSLLLRAYTTIATCALGLLLYLVPPTLAALLLWYGLHVFGVSKNQASQLFESSSIVQFLYVLITEIIVIGAIIWLLKLTHMTWRSIGVKKPHLSHVQYVITGLFVYYALYIVVAIAARGILPIDFDQKQEIGFDTTITGISLAAAFLSLVVLPPIVEEILFRGFLYSRFLKVLPKVMAAIVVSILFGAAHLQFGSGNTLLWVAALDTFILSLVLVYVREKTGTIWAGVGIHALKNLVAFTILFAIV